MMRMDIRLFDWDTLIYNGRRITKVIFVVDTPGMVKKCTVLFLLYIMAVPAVGPRVERCICVW